MTRDEYSCAAAVAAALVNQRARAACPFVFQRRVASKERCRTKNGCSCACGRARLVGCSNYHKISSLCARQHFYLQRRRRRMERAAFLFLYIRRVNGIELDLDVSARAAASHSHCAPRSVFPGARSKCS